MSLATVSRRRGLVDGGLLVVVVGDEKILFRGSISVNFFIFYFSV